VVEQIPLFPEFVSIEGEKQLQCSERSAGWDSHQVSGVSKGIRLGNEYGVFMRWVEIGSGWRGL